MSVACPPSSGKDLRPPMPAGILKRFIADRFDLSSQFDGHSEGIEESLIVVLMKERFLDSLGMTAWVAWSVESAWLGVSHYARGHGKAQVLPRRR
jgi:hypothetical protein